MDIKGRRGDRKWCLAYADARHGNTGLHSNQIWTITQYATHSDNMPVPQNQAQVANSLKVFFNLQQLGQRLEATVAGLITKISQTTKTLLADELRDGNHFSRSCAKTLFSMEQSGIISIKLLDYWLGFGIILDRSARFYPPVWCCTHSSVKSGNLLLPQVFKRLLTWFYFFRLSGVQPCGHAWNGWRTHFIHVLFKCGIYSVFLPELSHIHR